MSPGTKRPSRWNRAELYAMAGLGFAAVAGGAVLAAQSVAGGRSVYASLWILIAALLVLGGWLFGRQEDRLRRMSMTDPLTGLANRRELERRLEQERARAMRHGEPLTLLLIDVDLLKEINDRSGHRAGDRALLAVADALRSSCRAVDIAARVGGDEFAVLAPATSGREAMPLAARIQSLLRSSAPISVSIGIADLRSAEELQGDLLEAADRALYRAKSGGRDRISLHANAGERTVAPLRVLPGGAR